jgi:hypothetical protein
LRCVVFFASIAFVKRNTNSKNHTSLFLNE